MKVYDSFGCFDINGNIKTFDLTIQTTNLGSDNFFVSQYYDISNQNGYAILVILETNLKNRNDLSNYPPNSAIIESRIKLNFTNNDYTLPNSKDINNVTSNDKILVITHHAIDFNPIRNQADEDIIINNIRNLADIIINVATNNGQIQFPSFLEYSAALLSPPVVSNPSPPARSGNGFLIGR